MNGFSELTTLLTTFFTDLLGFFQGFAAIAITSIVCYYKIREALANAQEDQMFAQKFNKALIALVIIFLSPTFVSIIQNYFLNS